MPNLNDGLRYFNLNRDVAGGPQAQDSGGKQLHWLPQYLTLFVGVLIQPAFSLYRQTGTWSFPHYAGWGLFALITAFMIFPAAYRASFDPGKPLPLMLAPIFTAGLGWESLVSTALKAVGVNGGG